jgi:hypothetical protein
VGQQVVGQQHRLGLLEVRVARQVRPTGVVGPGSQGGLQAAHEGRQLGQLPPDPQPQVGGDLVVAAPASVEPGASVAGDLGDPPLDGGVDVLVRGGELEGAAGHLGLDGVEGVEHRCGVGLVEQPDPGQHPDVSPGAGDVLPEHPLVERQAVVEGLEGLCGPLGEPAVPERGHGVSPCPSRPAWRRSATAGRSAG